VTFVRISLGCGLWALGCGLWAAAQAPVPVLDIEAPAELAGTAERLGESDAAPLGRLMRLTGLADAGPPIRVVLETERTPLAAGTPAWVAGFAVADRDLVVIFPARVGSYPYRSIESVLHHEVAHVLVGRAARGQPVPRWFHEGLSTAAEGGWSLAEQGRLTWGLLRHGPASAADLDRLFAQGPPATPRAYAIANAWVREILERHGPDAPARVLALVGEGRRFEDAFRVVTGTSLDASAERFWRRQQLWERWIPLLTSTFTLWMAVTLLALLAIVRHRLRRARRRRLWDEEER
jgi:hypothetical protein